MKKCINAGFLKWKPVEYLVKMEASTIFGGKKNEHRLWSSRLLPVFQKNLSPPSSEYLNLLYSTRLCGIITCQGWVLPKWR
jgi:hypothetical protein